VPEPVAVAEVAAAPLRSDRPEPLTPRVIVARDALVTILTDDGAAWIYWELAPRSIARARARWPEGRAVIQVVALVPRWDGARRFEREVAAEPSSGSALVPPHGERAVVRTALGWRDRSGFHPIAVGTELAPPNGPGDGTRVRWAPSPRSLVDTATQERALARFVATRAT
jgi:hypothetical protein